MQHQEFSRADPWAVKSRGRVHCLFFSLLFLQRCEAASKSFYLLSLVLLPVHSFLDIKFVILFCTEKKYLLKIFLWLHCIRYKDTAIGWGHLGSSQYLSSLLTSLQWSLACWKGVLQRFSLRDRLNKMKGATRWFWLVPNLLDQWRRWPKSLAVLYH